MKGRSLSILGIFAAMAGAVFIICCNSINVAGLTIASGVLFVAAGLMNLIFFSSMSAGTQEYSRALSFISNAGAIVLGISMLVFVDTFQPLISFMLGLLIAVCALWQFFVLAIGARPFQLPAWLYLFPVLLVVGAIYIFIIKSDSDNDSKLMLATGISLAVLAAGCIIEGSVLGVARRSYNKAKAAAAAATHTESPTTDTDAGDQVTGQTAGPATIDPRPARRQVATTDDLDDEIEE